ncbi:hypothetical protein JCM11251_006774 [Rhodosporidiobolus azoricus]
MAHQQDDQQRNGRPLLPSFASGRTLPPPVPSGYSSSRGSDPRAYSYASGSTTSGSGWSHGGTAPSTGRGGEGGYGGRLSPAATSPFARPATVHPTPRRPLSPARSSLSLRPSQPFSQPAPPLSANNVHSLRSTTSFSSLSSHTATQRPLRPPSPPLVSGPPSRPSFSSLSHSSQTRRVSQVEPDSPTYHFRASSPANGSSSDKHRSTRANEPGYRSLVRRASGSNLSAAADNARSPIPRPSLSAYSSAPSLPPSASHLPSTTRPPLSTSAIHSLPAYGAPIPLTNRPSSPPKRTNFSALELKLLQGLWNAGGYYPSVQQVEEVQMKTGLSRTQIRNWFANRRQRSSGEEKSRVQKMARELGVV